jgi:hypothetical protein
MRKVRASLHEHLSTPSDMSRLDIPKVIKLASKRLGEYGILGITNFADERAEQLRDLVSKRYETRDTGNALYLPQQKLWIVKSQEVPCHTPYNSGKEEDAHPLIIGGLWNEHLENERPLEETLRTAKKKGLITVIDHPFHIWGAGPVLKSHLDYAREVLPNVDALETYNASSSIVLPIVAWFPFANSKSRRYFEEVSPWFKNLGCLTNTDGHSVFEVANSYTNLGMPNPKSISSDSEMNYHLGNAIRANKNPENGKRNSVVGFVGGFWHGIELKVLDRFREPSHGKLRI